MSKAHDRQCELVFVADDSAESVVVSEVNYYRTPSDTKYPIKFTQVGIVTGSRIVLGELLPPPTEFLLTFTVVP